MFLRIILSKINCVVVLCYFTITNVISFHNTIQFYYCISYVSICILRIQWNYINIFFCGPFPSSVFVYMICTGCSFNIVFFPWNVVIFLNSASYAAALVFYLPGVCTHTDTEGKQRKARVRNILKSSDKKHNIQWTPCKKNASN